MSAQGVAFICGPGPWRVAHAACPWCCLPGDPRRRCLEALVFGGWCGSDLICGHCGYEWSTDDDVRRKGPEDEERQENIAKVAAVPDPKCWKCHDSGWIESPIAEPARCECASQQREG